MEKYRIVLKSYDKKIFLDKNKRLTNLESEAFLFNDKRKASNMMLETITRMSPHFESKIGIHVTEYRLEEVN